MTSIRFSALLSIVAAVSIAGCGSSSGGGGLFGNASPTAAGGSGGGGGGSSSAEACAALLACCESMTDSSAAQVCVGAAQSALAANDGGAQCATLESSYASTGMCAAGVGGQGPGQAGSSSGGSGAATGGASGGAGSSAGVGGATSQGGMSAGLGGAGGIGAPGGTAGAGGGGTGAMGGSSAAGMSAGGGGAGGSVDPATCADAASSPSNLGCDFWPTVTGNAVWPIFDFAVLVTNPGTESASVHVSGPAGFATDVNVAPSEITKIYLPWVDVLKGNAVDECGSVMAVTASVGVVGGAYHLTSTLPVAVFQHSAIEYKGQGGPPGKSWASCPGDLVCASDTAPIGCFSFSNDASLLYPTTSLRQSYRVVGSTGWTNAGIGPYVVITATQDGTMVTMQLSATATVLSGTGITGASPGGTVSLLMNAGDAVELIGSGMTLEDLSGSLIRATAPIQVISGSPCMESPVGTAACDHLEESLPPAETLGRHYVVAQPTGPNGMAVEHDVRLVGNEDGTTLTYPSGAPANAPATLDAGQVVDLGEVASDFEVLASAPIEVGTILAGGAIADPNAAAGMQQGDPSLNVLLPLEQQRTRYVVATPDDYVNVYLDIIGPTGATITVDGSPVTTSTPIANASFSIARIQLGVSPHSHEIVADMPVGVEILGYGEYTSFHHSAGANAALIAPAPMK